jgi:transposase
MVTITNLPVHWYGIDVSKDNLVIAEPTDQTYKIITIANTPASIHQWIKTLKPNAHCILEYTGNYSCNLSYLLHKSDVKQSLLTPQQSKSYSRVQKNITKTDSRDAILLAQYGQREQPELYRMKNDNLLAIKQIRTVIRQQSKLLRMLQNQLHAVQYVVNPLESVIEIYEQTIQKIQENIAHLVQQITTLTDGQLKELIEKAQTVIGVGPKTAQEIIISTNGFEGFDNVNQVAKLAGVAPMHEQSGNYTKKGKINKNANPHLRTVLYMAAISAKQHNTVCKELFLRLRQNGKTVKQALIAVAHKLIKQIWGVIKSNKDFDNEYHLKKQKV